MAAPGHASEVSGNSPLLRVRITSYEQRELRALAARMGKTVPELLGELVRLVLHWSENADEAALASLLERGPQ